MKFKDIYSQVYLEREEIIKKVVAKFFLIAFIDFHNHQSLSIFELINPNLHRNELLQHSDSLSLFRLLLMILNDTQSLQLPSNSPRTQFFFCFSIVMLKRKINSSLTKKDKRCVIFIFLFFRCFFRGMNLSIFYIKHFWREAPKGVFVFMANDNDVLFSPLFHSMF